MRGFLREWLREVEAERLPANGWVGAANRLFKLAKSTHGKKAAKKFGVEWQEILPLEDIALATNQKISTFREKQIGAK